MINSENSKNRLSELSNIQEDLQNIGTIIKKAREEQNISLEFLSEILKINEDYLIAIEQGDKSALPESVYVKAMVRRIFELLKIKTIKTTVQSNHLAKDSIHKKELAQTNPKITSYPKILYFQILLLSLIAILLGAYSTRLLLQFTSEIDIKHEAIHSPSKKD